MQANLAKTSYEFFADDGHFPNSTLPVVIYAQAVADPSPEAMEALFDANDWPSAWRYGVYDYHHFHSTAHEVLGVARGSASLHLGGPEGRIYDVRAGDVILLPAGTGHKNLGSSPDFLVVGAYPPGTSADMMYGKAGERPGADERIAKVPLPKTDPVGGQGGPVLEKWG